METTTQTKQLVTKDMTIGDVVNKYPQATDIMLKYGLHCIGCSVNPYETIENGCLGHGMDETTVENLLKDINGALNGAEEKIKKVVSLTQAAADKLREFMKEDHKEGFGVKLEIVHEEGDTHYTLDFADQATEHETVFEDLGIKIFVASDLLDEIKGTEVDFIDNERGSGFKVNGPKLSSGGCGTGCGCSE